MIIDLKKDHIVFGTIKEVVKSFGHQLPFKDEGDVVMKGEVLSTGSLDVKEYKEIVGDIQAQKYIISEVKKIYLDQGQTVHDKHIEVIVKQMFSKVFIQDSGDTSFVP
jgi:DNA-directed RNA polymerase subunit beta'